MSPQDRPRERTSGFVTEVLVTLGAIVVASGIVGYGPESSLPVRTAAAVAVALVFPGYALTTVLFPGRAGTSRGVGGLARAALSVGLSVVVLTLVGFGLDAFGFPFATVPTLVGVVLVTVPLFGAGVLRRLYTAPRERFLLPLPRFGRLGSPGLSLDAVLNVGLVAVVLLSVTMFGYALVAPQDGTTYTSVRLVTEQPSGEYAQADYRTTYQPGDRGDYVLAIENLEGEPVEYTVVIELQRTTTGGGEETVVDSERLTTLEATVPHNETRYLDHGVEPTLSGEQLQLVYMVYRGSVPAEPSTDSAYRYLKLRITVTDG